MIYKQGHTPVNAQTGDAWTDGVSFKRVLSRGGAWENVNLGSTHPDEVNHERQQEQRAEAQRDAQQVSERTRESAPRDGDDGEAAGLFGSSERTEEPHEVSGLSTPENPESTEPVFVQPDGSVAQGQESGFTDGGLGPEIGTGPNPDFVGENSPGRVERTRVEGDGIDANGSEVV